MLIGVQYRLALAALLASFCLFAATAGKPLQLDNVDFPAVAKQTAASWRPIYYRGEPNPSHTGPRTRGVPLGLYAGLWHPPLYIYMLAAWIKLLGFGEARVRMFGYVCALLQGWIVLELARALFGSETMRRIAGWYWLLFLLNPYTLQTASIADIDSTIYGPLLCAVLLVAVRMSWHDGVWRLDPVKPAEYAILCGLLVLTMWAKLTTVLLLPPALVFLLAKRMGWARAFFVTAAATLSSAAIFLATYYAYGAIANLDINYTFAFTVASLSRGQAGAGIAARLAAFWTNFLAMTPAVSAWTGLVPWLAAIAAVFAIGWRLLKDRAKPNRGQPNEARWIHALVLAGLALLTTGYYCAQTLTFGRAPFKYTFVYWGIIAACPVLWMDFLWNKSFRVPEAPARRWVWIAIFVYYASALVGVRFVQDRMLMTGMAEPYSRSLFLPALVFILAFAAWRIAPRLAGGLAACAVSAAAGCALGVAAYQTWVPYSTTYDYGQTGFDETVGFIRAHTQPDQEITSMKDIGFKAERKYIENYGPLYGAPDDPFTWLTTSIRSGKVRYEVFTAAHGQDNLWANPLLKSWIEDNCVLAASFGDYRIYSYKVSDAAQR